MIKLITFDLDSTLAELGKGILPENIELLKQLEQMGVRIAICSGKPTYYLCGFMRQVGLERPVLVGENGAVVQFGVDLPPKDFYILPYSKAADETIRRLERQIRELVPGMFYQPNIVGLTPFPRLESEFEQIQDLFDREKEELKDVVIYRHVDSFDIVPTGIDKYTGMEYLGKLLGISPEETIAVGDGVNDYPMFEYAGYSVGIHVTNPEKVDRNFQNITQALLYIKELIKKN